jgi:prepilin-type N-terminal cleavage/methylation domain-containing protein
LVKSATADTRVGGALRDSGVTMIEVVISMVVMSIAMTIFTTGFLQIYRTINKTESLSTAQAQVTIAFQRLDREVRYAAAISTQEQVGQDYYVEYLITPPSRSPSASASPPPTRTLTCVELRLQTSTRQLQRRTWPNDGSPVTPTAWAPLVSEVVAAQPFTFIAADPNVNYHQSLRVNVTVMSGSGATETLRRTDVTFTALNTTIATSSTDICTEGRAVP